MYFAGISPVFIHTDLPDLWIERRSLWVQLSAVTGQPSPDQQLDDHRFTVMGLLVETHAGVRAACDPQLAAGGMSTSTFEVLLRLARSPGGRLPMTELALQTTLSNSGLTRVVDRLLERDWAVRSQDPDDRRVFYAVITPAGLDALMALVPGHLEVVDRLITDVLDPDELAAFMDALRKIRAVAKPGSDPSLAVAEAEAS